LSSPEDGRPEGPPEGDVAPTESTPSGAEVDQPAAAADDVRPDEPTSDTEGTGVDSPVAQQEDTGDAEGAGTTEPKDEAGPADAPADATAPEQPAAAEGDAEAEVDVPVAEPEEPVHDERLSPVLDALAEALGDAVVASELAPGRDLWVRIRLDAWAEAAEICRDRLGMTYFCFLSAIDWLPSPFGKSEDDSAPAVVDPSAPLDHGVTGGDTRFQLLARLERPGAGIGVTLKTDVPDDALVAPTWTGVFAGADWHERETHEMFGIDFAGHPYLRNLYLPGAFEGYPLRKDFPLLARMVKPWPGLVDVEPMPGEPEEDAETAEAEAEA
jgi:NADH-quinone oxidoreductase subunit C